MRTSISVSEKVTHAILAQKDKHPFLSFIRHSGLPTKPFDDHSGTQHKLSCDYEIVFGFAGAGKSHETSENWQNAKVVVKLLLRVPILIWPTLFTHDMVHSFVQCERVAIELGAGMPNN
jgi:hypothetical protein